MSQLSQRLNAIAEELRLCAQLLDPAAARTAPPPSSPAATNPAAAPPCPVHGQPMKISRHGGGFFCPQRAEPFGWCQERAA